MRIATFNQKPDVDEEKHEAFRQWMGAQPGMIAGYHVVDGEGRYISVSVWRSREDLMAMRERKYPAENLGLKPDHVAICDVTSTFGPRA